MAGKPEPAPPAPKPARAPIAAHARRSPWPLPSMRLAVRVLPAQGHQRRSCSFLLGSFWSAETQLVGPGVGPAGSLSVRRVRGEPAGFSRVGAAFCGLRGGRSSRSSTFCCQGHGRHGPRRPGGTRARRTVGRGVEGSGEEGEGAGDVISGIWVPGAPGTAQRARKQSGALSGALDSGQSGQ